MAGKSASACHYHSVKLAIPVEVGINISNVFNIVSHVLPGDQGLCLPCSLPATPGGKKGDGKVGLIVGAGQGREHQMKREGDTDVISWINVNK